jgi:hypothetical protein
MFKNCSRRSVSNLAGAEAETSLIEPLTEISLNICLRRTEAMINKRTDFSSELRGSDACAHDYGLFQDEHDRLLDVALTAIANGRPVDSIARMLIGLATAMVETYDLPRDWEIAMLEEQISHLRTTPHRGTWD